MHVWRFPIIFFAWLSVTTVLTAALIALFEVRSRIQRPVIRGFLASAAVLALAASPFVVHLLTEKEFAFLVKHGVYKHYAWWAYLLPAVASVAIVVAGYSLFRRSQVPSATKWRIAFVGACFGFAFLNLANWCSPGWCERFGFPFPYSWWSDAIIIMNGKNLSAGASTLALAANFATFAFVVVVMVRTARRKAAQVAPPN